MPSRPILDFLIQYFFAEVNWLVPRHLKFYVDSTVQVLTVTLHRMDQLLYPPWFLGQYQKWWNMEKPLSVTDIEFSVLFLRICSYASQFLPSPAYTIDSIRGMALADIRKSCDGVADALAPICTRLDARGSLLRVQHLAFVGLRTLCQGRTNAFWEELNSAIRVAQRISIDAISWTNGIDELEKEMRRRTFCNLYVWDRYVH